MHPKYFRWSVILWLLATFQANVAWAATVELSIDVGAPIGAVDLTRYGLGQGGLSDRPMFDAHLEQLRQLHPQTIRIFVQEYFDLYPKHKKFNWTSLDKTLETVAATGAKPILSLCFKPKVLFPAVDQRVVQPTNYREWEELIYRLVKHCNLEKKFGVAYWEVGNEPDIGEDGGCPYLFQAADYLTYYTHTAAAIRRADPAAKVGGPALAGYQSQLGVKLMEYCGTGAAPLDFFSWHIYSNDPETARRSIREIKGRLAKFPRLVETETLLDEWNMSLEQPVLKPAFQPAYILQTTSAFLEEGLSRSSYYHIRDYFVDERLFSKFMSTNGTRFMARWWNEMPQYDGLYDNLGQVRPAYYTFRLLALLKGEQLKVTGGLNGIKGLAAKTEGGIHALVWNFTKESEPAALEVKLTFSGKERGRFRRTRLNAERQINQLQVEQVGELSALEEKTLRFELKPYDIQWVYLAN